MAAPTYPDTISGKYLTANIGGSAIAGVQEWSAREDGDRLDGTTGADEGFENDDIGVSSLEVTIMLVQNLSTGEYSAVKRGTLISNLKLYRSAGDTVPAFTVPSFRVYNSENAGRVKERFTLRVTGRSKGAYTANDPGAAS